MSSTKHPSRWTAKRLRILLATLLVAIVAPTLVLIHQAYDQLQWESFYQFSQRAAALAGTIDRRLNDSIRTEDRRPFSDYFFISAAGTSNLLSRSPLAVYPPETTLPGVIGYFQVDHDGEFSSPILPIESAENFGISEPEQTQRQRLHDRLRDLLVNNQLVIPEDAFPRAAEPTTNQTNPAYPSTSSRSIASTDALSDSATLPDSTDSIDPEQSWMTEDKDSTVAAVEGLQRKQEAREVTSPAIARSPADSQARFDQLTDREVPLSEPEQELQAIVAEFELDERLQAADTNKARERESSYSLRSKRAEQVFLPAGDLYNNDAEIASTSSIETFRGELDPLQFNELDSGELILHRKAWRNQQRLVQGLLLDRTGFFDSLRQVFADSDLSKMADLRIAWRGSLLQSTDSTDRDLKGTLLHRHQLTPPLAEVELLFVAHSLPGGAGGKVLIWSASLLGLALFGGIFAIYRVGLRQISLAQQQQDFVSAVSHELKTPLTSIRMYSEMLRQGWTSPDKAQGYYDFIHGESERLSRLIENVLQLARMTRNELSLRIESVEIGTIVDMLRSKLASAIEQAGFELKIECPDSLQKRRLATDSDCLAQVFINLIDNAIKFSDEGPRRIDLTVTLQHQSVRFGVRDFGPGIDQGQMKKIFQLFYRPANELTRETAGTGIGLALVKQLTSALDGEIDVKNCHPGAEFFIVFPLESID